MTPFAAPVAFVGPDGKLTTAALQWIARLIGDLQAKDAVIAALEARIAALEA